MAVALDGTEGAETTEGRNMAGEPRDTLSFSGLRLAADAAAPVRGGTSRAALYRRGALARATMMSGALETAMDLAVTYAQERQQFGRPISKFQAVQQNLAVLAGQTAAAVAAANLGIESLSRNDPERRGVPHRDRQDAGWRRRNPGVRDRPPGAWRDRLYPGICVATCHPAPVVLARGVRPGCWNGRPGWARLVCARGRGRALADAHGVVTARHATRMKLHIRTSNQLIVSRSPLFTVE